MRLDTSTFNTRLAFVKALGGAFLTALLSTALATASPANTVGLAGGWEFHQGAIGSTWEIWRGDKATDNVTWTPVTLPHCFNAGDAVDPDVHYYQGPGWYRIRLKLANPFPNGRTLLHFDGAGQRSQVFVGLGKVAEHLGGYDKWTVDITEAAARARENANFEGEVALAVLCDNSRDAESIPSDLSDFNRYGGLYRHVSLIYAPAISVERVHVSPTLRRDGSAPVRVKARLYNPAALKDEVELSLQIRDPQGEVIHADTKKLEPWADAKEIAVFEIVRPQLWSPKTPSLYHCTVTLKSPHGEQAVSERFGVRSVEWAEHGPFKLNGERLLLRGTHYHEDHAGAGAAVPDQVVRRTLQQIKDMGANFVRLGHYQQAPLVPDLCDELGLLVWEEIPWCRGGLGGERYKQQCRDMLGNMINQHRNHPSVILWGLGNENDWPGDFETFNTNAIRAFMTELNTLAHQLDPSRQTSIRRCDFCRDIVDVYSPSIWAGWYSGRYPEYRASIEKAIRNTKHFFHAEWGGDSHARRHSEDPEKFLQQIATGEGTAEVGKAYKPTGGKARASKDGDWSESYIVNLFDWHLKEQEQMTNLTGSAQWIFKDFATPLRPENPVPRVNEKGVVERDGTPKESYYVFQSYWAEQPMIHLYGHTWPVRWGKAGEEKLVKVFSNCREVELFVNGKSAGVKQRNAADFPAAGLRWLVKFSEGTNTLRAVGRRDRVELSDAITVEYQTARWSAPAKLTLAEMARSNNIVTIQARVFDSNGVPCLDAANMVRFGLTGDGRLIDNLGTSTGSRMVGLYNGRAQISLQLTGSKVVASVASDGLDTAFASMTNAAGELAGVGHTTLTIDVAASDREHILKAANAALTMKPVTITAFTAKLSEGGPNDFYSNGDYWWPDPTKPDGLPYIQRDGESNPDNFWQHRMAVRDLRDAVAALGAAYKITGDDRYVTKAVELLRVFFFDPHTRMNPHLRYAQAIPGRSAGRGIGIIDALHLIEIPPAVTVMEQSPAFPAEVLSGLKKWFAELADWMVTSKNGRDEAATKNNHSVAYFLQLAVYAKLVGDESKLAECRRQFKEVFVPNQMAADGSFPAELKRTKPYGYSIFQLDNMATLCQVLSTSDDNLWEFELPDGRGLRKAMAYLYPYLTDKSKWPLKPDVQAWESWPARQPGLLFAGLALGEHRYLDLWKKLPPDPTDDEVRRNIAITQPLLWLNASELSGHAQADSSGPLEPALASAPTSEAVLAIMERVADWALAHPSLANPSKRRPTDWTMGALYTGMMALTTLSTDHTYLDAMIRVGEENDWKLGPRKYHADDHCVGQTYVELYLRSHARRMIEPMRQQFDEILTHPSAVESLEFRQLGRRAQELWSWCDSLFMSPPAWVRLWAATDDPRYLDFAVTNWWRTSDFLYDKAEHLYFRDSTFFDRTEANGKKVFWSRGNGWVMGGLVRVLQFLPKDHPARPRFEQQFREMADKLLTCQQTDGLWRASLLDPDSYPLKEASGSGFFTYAFAWGVNAGLLEHTRFEPAVRKAWSALNGCVDAEGKLTHVQSIGSDPKHFDQNATEAYGIGAFLLAGSEVYRMESSASVAFRTRLFLRGMQTN